MFFSFNAGYIVDNYLYYSDNNCNALLRIDLVNNHVSYLGEFPEESGFQRNMHKYCVRINTKLIFIPSMGKHLHYYDYEKGVLQSVYIHRKNITDYSVAGVLVVDDELIIFPGVIENELIRCSYRTGKIIKENIFNSIIRNLFKRGEQVAWKTCEIDNKVYFALIGTSLLGEYNILTKSIRVIDTKVPAIDSVYRTIDGLILCTRNMKVFKYCLRENFSEECDIRDFRSNRGSYIVVNNDTDIWLVSNHEKTMFYKDGKKGFKSFNPNNNDVIIDEKKDVWYENYTLWNNKIVLFPVGSNRIPIIENNNVCYYGDNLEYEKEYLFKLKSAFRERACNEYIYEYIYSLQEFISII